MNEINTYICTGCAFYMPGELNCYVRGTEHRFEIDETPLHNRKATVRAGVNDINIGPHFAHKTNRLLAHYVCVIEVFTVLVLTSCCYLRPYQTPHETIQLQI